MQEYEVEEITKIFSLEPFNIIQTTEMGSIILNFKTVQDGATQVGPTSMVKFLSNSTTSRERINITSYIDVSASPIYYNFWVQNPTSGAAATLQPESTAASWGTDVPSAQLIITKLI